MFGQANGTSDSYALLERLDRLGSPRNVVQDLNRVIGCIAVSESVFFPPDEWVTTPDVSGRVYNLQGGPGQRLWHDCLERAAARRAAAEWALEALLRERTGRPA